MASKTRAQNAVYLIGIPYSQILGAKLPSKKQVLSVFLFNHRTLKMTVRESASLVFDELSVFWAKAHIPIQTKHRSIEKFLKLHEKWLHLFRSSTKGTETQQQNEAAFVETLDDLFDVATASALETIKIEEDRQFLLLQRQKGRVGLMVGIDTVSVERDKKRLLRLERETERKKKAEAEMVRMLTDSSEGSAAAGNEANVDAIENMDINDELPSTSRGKT